VVLPSRPHGGAGALRPAAGPAARSRRRGALPSRGAPRV